MKLIIQIILTLAVSIFMVACENDFNKDFDMTSPKALIEVDSFEVKRGDVISIKALLSDESGLNLCKFDYANWGISNEVLLRNEGTPQSYQYKFDVKVPVDALLSWKETYQKHDGSTFIITQTYHKLALTFEDGVKNKNVVYFYIKVVE